MGLIQLHRVYVFRRLPLEAPWVRSPLRKLPANPGVYPADATRRLARFSLRKTRGAGCPAGMWFPWPTRWHDAPHVLSPNVMAVTLAPSSPSHRARMARRQAPHRPTLLQSPSTCSRAPQCSERLPVGVDFSCMRGACAARFGNKTYPERTLVLKRCRLWNEHSMGGTNDSVLTPARVMMMVLVLPQ